MSECLRVVVIGCGNIAGGFDASRPADALPLTHAGAFQRHGGFELVACVDPDADRRSAFAARWGVPVALDDVEELRGDDPRPDVISICSPTALHDRHLAAALRLRPRLVFCEKPVTPDAATTARWIEAFERAGIAFATNYTRRWAPDVIRHVEALRRGEWGAIRSIHGVYNKGVLNNGSHMLDLLLWLLGPLQPEWVGEPRHDFWPDDPSVPAVLRSGDGTCVQLALGHAADYSYFELQVVAAHGVVVMEDGGAAWRLRRAAESPVFRGYRSLDAGPRLEGEYSQAMLAAAGNIHAALTRGAPLASDGANALEAQRLCELLRRQADAATRPR